jgi:uncharacterized protein YukJ
MLTAHEAELAERTYGVLVGRVRAGTLDPAATADPATSAHYEIWIDAGSQYRVAVNVRSVDTSEVLVHYDAAYALPTKRDLPGLAAGPAGFTPLAVGVDGAGLDYLRDGLFPIGAMQAIPPDGAGVTLQNLLDAVVARAVSDAGAVAIAFGDGFKDPGSDKTFGFAPEQGVHDIHMMQGNSGSFAGDNRINGDGALFIRFTGGATTALFVRFASQAIDTDAGGAPVPASQAP